MSEPTSEFHEVQHHRVTVEYRTPALDWLDRLRTKKDGTRCTECLRVLDETPIYVNTEGKDGDELSADYFCSWACLLRIAARCLDGIPQAGIIIEHHPTAEEEGT